MTGQAVGVVGQTHQIWGLAQPCPVCAWCWGSLWTSFTLLSHL